MMWMMAASLSLRAAPLLPALRPVLAAPRLAPVQAVQVDLTDPATAAVFFLWGSPVPVLFSSILKETERLEERLPASALSADPMNMGYAFPSFQAQMDTPTEPSLLGPPGSTADRAVRWLLALNVYAGIGWYLWYKYQIEDELKQRTGEGLGGALIVLPFAAGLILGIVGQVLYGSLETLDFFSGSF